MNTDFQTAYLKSLNLIKQEEEDKKDKKCPDCGKEPCECDDKKDVDNECGDADATNDNKEVINDDVDDEVKDDAEEAEADDAEGSDDDSDEGEEDVKEQGDEEAATCFCFKTTNQSLIDAINSGFDKVVFTVKAKDDEGNDTTTEVEFTGDDFADFEECDECEDEDEESSDDITDDDLAAGMDDVEGDEGGDDSLDFDDEDMSFESVFKRYYGSLVSEQKK